MRKAISVLRHTKIRAKPVVITVNSGIFVILILRMAKTVIGNRTTGGFRNIRRSEEWGLHGQMNRKKVIHSRTGNLLVSAAAGSGKTAVLVERILEMVTGTDADGNRISEGMDIDEVLVVTFTNAAAAQMKEKIADKLTKMAEAFPENQHIVKQLSLLQRADIMTIDGFCRSIVKEYFHTIGIDSSFDIADKAEMDLIKNDILDEVLEEQYQEASERFLGLVNCFSRKESDASIRELVYQIYRVASGYPKPEKWIQEALQALAVSSREELQELKWYRDFLTLFHNTVDAAIAQAEYCRTVAMEPDGPAGYLDIILSDLDWLYQLQKAGDIDEIYNRSEKLKSLKRIAKCNPEKQQAVRAHLKTYHESIKALLAVVRPSEEILAECAMMAGPLSALLELTLAYMNRLRQEKKNRNLYEFRDISEFAYDILCAGEDETGHVVPSAAGISVSERYREILIDEYQDSNFFAGRYSKLCVRIWKRKEKICLWLEISSKAYISFVWQDRICSFENIIHIRM